MRRSLHPFSLLGVVLVPSLGVAVESVRVVPDGSRARGSLRIETDIGVLDADLAPQLDRLALRLRETLSHES